MDNISSFLPLTCVFLVFLPPVLCVGGRPDHMVYDNHHDHNHGIDSSIMDEDYNGNIDENVRMDDVRRDVE